MWCHPSSVRSECVLASGREAWRLRSEGTESEGGEGREGSGKVKERKERERKGKGKKVRELGIDVMKEGEGDLKGE